MLRDLLLPRRFENSAIRGSTLHASHPSNVTPVGSSQVFGSGGPCRASYFDLERWKAIHVTVSQAL